MFSDFTTVDLVAVLFKLFTGGFEAGMANEDEVGNLELFIELYKNENSHSCTVVQQL